MRDYLAAHNYQQMRREHPERGAADVWRFVHHEEGMTFEQFTCPGHEWTYTGTAYGGDDDSYMGEGRCFCANCGMDGDA